jgi:N-acetylglucosamine-6-sulfatase
MAGGSTGDMSPALRDEGSVRASVAALVAVLVCGVAVALPREAAQESIERPPNVLLVITDDQPWDTLPATEGPPAMPWLESRLADPTDHWVRFTNAFLNVPLCCPSRASILTGRYARHTGVESNGDGADLDESSTLATWLDGAGYQTAFIGKYLNGYPWDRGPYVPAGWDRFLAKRNLDVSTTYEGYPFIDQGVPLSAGTSGEAYATSLLGNEASAFLRGASRAMPWFLVYAPSAPHEPWTPDARDVGSFAGVAIATPSSRVVNDVRGKPAWVRALPALDASAADALVEDRRSMLESLRAVDRVVGSLIAEVQARGELEHTIVVFLSDNGYSFGQHRWVGKRCPYDACVRTPLVVRSPWTESHTVTAPVSNVDLAPTLLDLVGIDVPEPTDGLSLRAVLDDRIGGSFSRDAVLIEWAGDGEVPAWRGVRTEAFTYLEHADGAVELYDLVGRLGPADPSELRNRADDPAYSTVRRELALSLEELVNDPLPSVP